MDFFKTIFDGLVGLSEKLPSVEVGAFAVAAFVALILAAVVIGLTFLGSGAARFTSACRRVLAYLDDESAVTDDNVADFTAECFGAKAPAALRDGWVQFLGVRFGYPGEIVSESGVFDKAVKRRVSLRANIFIGVALILTALFAFWGLGAIGTAGVGVVLCGGLLLAAVGYIVLVVVARKQYDAALAMFREMQDALDAKVMLQVERDYSADASPLIEIASVLEGIVSRNTARPAPDFDFSVKEDAADAATESDDSRGAETEGETPVYETPAPRKSAKRKLRNLSPKRKRRMPASARMPRPRAKRLPTTLLWKRSPRRVRSPKLCTPPRATRAKRKATTTSRRRTAFFPSGDITAD